MKLFIKKMHENAVVPTFAHTTDAAMDLCTTVEITVNPGERVSVPTGIAMQIPDGHVGLIWDKSGISQKVGLKTLGGVIDAGYRGEIFVGLFNTGKEAHTFTPGQKVAQILIQEIKQPELEVVESLEDSSRGEGAFGSTGK
jgi:dUTP pyrophosphatase